MLAERDHRHGEQQAPPEPVAELRDVVAVIATVTAVIVPAWS